MTIIDIGIILILILGAIVGFKRGLTTQLVSTVGIILIIIVAFLLKNPVSEFMYKNLPFFDFGGLLKGISVLNIAVYEIIAFLIVLSVLVIVFKLLLKATKIFETLLKFTIILGIPSKIAGAVVGVIENYIFIFIILYIISLPVFNFNLESDYKDKILNNTPILSSVADNGLKVIEEFKILKEEYDKAPNANEFNRETLDLFLKYDVVTVESVETLINKDKLKIEGVETIINKYKEK